MTAPLRTSPSQVEETAKAIWKAMVEQATAKNVPRQETEYGSGWFLNVTIAEYARACWPGTNFSKGSGKTAMNMVRQFLKSTGNVVTLVTMDHMAGRKGKVFVRAYWAYRDSIPVIVGLANGAATERRQAIAAHEAEQRRKEAKVTPKEAGETLQPAPVEVRKGGIVSHPEYGKGDPDKRFPDFVRFSNGMAQCTECGKAFKPQGMGPHQKMHDDERRDIRLAELELTAAANLSSLDPKQALGMVQAYIATITQERDDAMRALAKIQATPVNTEAETKVELIAEILTRVQKGEVTMMRGLSDINDALEA